MNWTKFGDEYPVEARELTDAEWRTHGEALMWSNLNGLDLRIPKNHVRRFAETSVPIDIVTAGLEDKGWWRSEGREWYIGIVHPEWQSSSEGLRIDRDKAAARMRRVRRHNKGDHSLCTAGDCVRPNVRANVPNERSPHVHPNVHPNAQANGHGPDVLSPAGT